MKKHVSYLIIILPILLFCSCGKLFNTTETVKGKVTEYGTHTPIANAHVSLIKQKGSVIGQSSQSVIGNATTDNSGNYEIKYNAESDYSYGILANKEDYWEISDGVKEIGDIELKPFGWIKFNFIFNNKYDYFYFYGDWSSPNNFELFGYTNQIIHKVKIKGNQTINFAYQVEKNSIKTKWNGSKYCQGHDTTFYEIKY